MAARTLYSLCSSSRRWIYDVFISFRGEDTRKNFTNRLYLALKYAGINVFIDENELRRGYDIPEELLRAIKGSKISVIVFSRNYANSGWCLEELVQIMKGRRTLQQIVFPVFFDIDPSEVRKQTGSFGEALKIHNQQLPKDKVKVLRWRAALTEAANSSGWHLRDTTDENQEKLVNVIAEEVSRRLNNMHLFVTLYPIGLESRMQDISSLLHVGLDDVRMLGIWGMGGIGKTTIAKAIYNQYYHCFEGASFLGNVKKGKLPNELLKLQEQLLSNILKIKVEVEDVNAGINMILKRLSGRRVLVIIDDTDELEQLNALARSQKWFGYGSRIVITTRDKQLLKLLNVDAIYELEEMSDTESLELFSCHAFRRGYPDEGYSELSQSVVEYCKGLPLALEILGSFLHGRSRQEWISALEKLKTTPYDKILKKLKISYDALSDFKTKDVFLDICCFFIGMDKDYVIEILNGCSFQTEIEISTLLERHLITLGWDNEIMVHDLLREMGTNIIKERFPRQPGKWSRLWFHQDAVDVLTKQTGSEETEGFTLNMDKMSSVMFSTKAFENMQGLRLLRLNYVQLTGSYRYFSKELRWLCWHGCSLQSIPNEFYQENLVALDLQYSNLRQVWKDPKLLLRLKILNLGHSSHLTRSPDFSKLPNLKELILKDCEKLYVIHHSIGHLERLELLNLKGCKILKNLPQSLYKLKSLEFLDLSHCSMIGSLDEAIGEMVSLRNLIVDETGITKLPPTIGKLKNLVILSLSGLKGEKYNPLPLSIWSWMKPAKRPKSFNLLPPSIQWLSCLRLLHLNDCNLTDDAVPKELWSLHSLKSLDLKNNHFHGLAPSLIGLSELETLILDGNAQLQHISDLPPNLVGLSARNCVSLERVPNVSECPTMYHLALPNCKQLVEVPGLDQLSQSRIVFVSMEGCKNISSTFKQTIVQSWATAAGDSKICFPGDDIPECFTYISEGNFTSFEVPHMFNSNLAGLAVGIVCSFPVEHLTVSSLSVNNLTKGFFLTFDAYTFHSLECRGDQVWLGHFQCFWQGFEGGDRVVVLLKPGFGMTVKKIGVILPWDLSFDRGIIGNAALITNDDSIILYDNDEDGSQCQAEFGSEKDFEDFNNDLGCNHFVVLSYTDEDISQNQADIVSDKDTEEFDDDMGCSHSAHSIVLCDTDEDASRYQVQIGCSDDFEDFSDDIGRSHSTILCETDEDVCQYQTEIRTVKDFDQVIGLSRSLLDKNSSLERFKACCCCCIL